MGVFEVVETDRSFEVRMSATPENIDRADDRLAAYLTERRVAADLFTIRILLREAILNAVTHGSGSDPRRSVSLKFHVGDREATMIVADSGRGFAWQGRPMDFDVTGAGGRGLALMSIYADRVLFNAAGNEVTLCKQLNAAPARCAEEHAETDEETR